VALDFVLNDNKVCWTEIKKQVIRCSEINPHKKGRVEKVTVVETGLIRPEGLACDWVGAKIYWTDSETKRIEVASLEDHSLRKVLVWEDLDLPRAIAVAPTHGYMFWTDWGYIPRIERAAMSGDPATRVTLVDSDIQWPNGLTLDYEKGVVYWVEAKVGQISAVDFDGRNRRSVLVDSNLKQPFAITFHDRELYWTDWTTK
jgi:low density lipoprotein receptor-related protein 5/6